MHTSVIIPCLNEERTIVACIEKAKIGFAQAHIEGEIIVADNGSTDRSKHLAQTHGAKVITVPERGYGSAIQAGVEHASGIYVVIGDADDSYDFSIISLFTDKFRENDYDLLIGNRFSGSIEKGAMPFLNKNFGNPLISTVGKLLFGNVCNDFYCGLRAAKKESLIKLNLSQKGMVYAVEMIAKAAEHKMKIGEIPITLHRDGRGRPPHLRRWRDGINTIIFLFRYYFSK